MKSVDTNKRSWVKSVTWRIIGVVILGGITYLFTRDWGKTTWITLLFHLIRLVLYYYHERAWERVAWGRVAHPFLHLRLRDSITEDEIEGMTKLLEQKRYLVKLPLHIERDRRRRRNDTDGREPEGTGGQFELRREGGEIAAADT